MPEPIEIAFARLDERFQSFEKAFGQMVDDQRSLTLSYQKLVESNQRISLLEQDSMTEKKSLEMLWTKFDAHIAQQSGFIGSTLFELLKMLAMLGIGWTTGHWAHL
jgi:hypothetical protein